MTTSVAEYKARTRTELELPSGAVFVVRRPSPAVSFKAGRLPSNLTAVANQARSKKGESLQELGMKVLGKMSDEQMTAFVAYAAELVADVSVSPRIVVGATGEDELDPSDLSGDDFAFIFAWAAAGGQTLPVQTKGGEVAVKDLETFRAESGVREAGEHGEEVQPEAVAVAGN